MDEEDASDGEQDDGPWAFTQTEPEAFFSEESLMPQEDAKAKSKATTVLDADEHAGLVAKMARYILMKGSATEAIVMSKLKDDVLGDKYKAMRGLSAQVLSEAAKQVHTVFGYKLARAPKKHFRQAKFKDGFYLLNDLPLGKHRSEVLAEASPALRGLLMVCLACVYSSNHGSSSHKLAEPQLVQHLMRLDTNSTKVARLRDFGHEEYEGVVDTFVKQHYLIKEKDEDSGESVPVTVLSLGPRALLEVGRRQIVFFTHEAVGTTVDAALLEELAEDEKGNATEEEEGE